MSEPWRPDENADYCAQFKCFQPEPEPDEPDFEPEDDDYDPSLSEKAEYTNQ